MAYHLSTHANYHALVQHGLSLLLRVLNPITPHITHYLWQHCGFGETIETSEWPVADQKILALEDQVSIVVQFNGKKKAMIAAKSNATEQDVIEAIQSDALAKSQLEKHATIKKTIYVKNKLINFVI